MSIIGRVGIRGKIALCAALFSIVWVVVVLLLHGDMRSDPQFALPMDHHKYLAMAQQDVGTFRIAPFCWRIGAPAIAHAIGGDPWMVMMVLTALGVLLTTSAVALLVWDATTSIPHVIGACATVLAMGWLTRASVWTPATVDMLACGLMMTAVAIRHRGSWVVSACALCCAVLVKESALLALPIAYALDEQRSWKHLVVWSLPAVLLVGIVRFAIPAGNADPSYLATLPDTLRLVQHGTSTYSLSYLLSTVAYDRVMHPAPTDLWALTGDSFGVIVLLLVGAAFRNLPSIRVPLLVVCMLTVAQVFLAVNIQRVVLMSGPALAAIGWMHLCKTQLRWATNIIVYLACGSLIVTTVGSRVSAPVIAQLAVLATLVIAYVFHRRRVSEELDHA